jgi:hypothetical protein
MDTRLEHQIDLLQVEEGFIAKNQTVLRNLVEQEILGQRRALVGEQVFVGNQGDASGISGSRASARPELRIGCADDDKAAHDHASRA